MRMISLVLVVASMACYREATSPSSSGPSAPPIANKAAPPREPVASQDVLAYLPADWEFVVGFDFKALRNSALWAVYAPQIEAAGGVTLAEIREKCGIDLLRAMDSMTAGFRSIEAKDGVLVVRGVQRDTLMSCNTLERHASDPVEVSEDHGIFTLLSSDGKKDLLAFADRSTLVFQSSAQDTADSMRAVLRSGAPLRRSPGFIATFERLPPGAAIWFVMNGNASVLQSVPADAPIRGMFGAVRVDENVTISMHVMVDDAGHAAQNAALLDQALKRARPLFTRLAATSDGATITVECELSSAQLQSLVTVMRSMYSKRAAKPSAGKLSPVPLADRACERRCRAHGRRALAHCRAAVRPV